MTVTRTEVERLAKVLRDEMVLSVAIDGTLADPAQLHAWHRNADATIASAAAPTTASSSERDALARAIALVRASLPTTPAELAGGGWIACATGDRLELAGVVPHPIGTRAEWARGARVGLVLSALDRAPSTLAVLVDSVSASVYRCTPAGAQRLVHLHAHTGDAEPTHMGAQPREHFHPGTRGRTASEAAQLARREGHRRMVSDLADRAEKLAGRASPIVVGGEPSAAREAAAALDARCPQRVTRAEQLRVNAADHEIAAAAAMAARLREHAREQAVLVRVLERASSGGRGVTGRPSVRAALAQGAVRELLASSASLDPARPELESDTEELIALALAEGASVTVVSGVAAAALDARGDGVAAELRFVPVAAGAAEEVRHGAAIAE